MQRPVAALLIVALLLDPVLAAAQALDVRPLAPADELHVTVPGPAPIDRPFEIDADGAVDLGSYGRVILGGLSLSEASAKLRTHLGAFLRNTDGVTLRLRRSRRLVVVTGLVAKPGAYAVDAGTDLWRIVTAAGGPVRGADLTRVVLVHEGAEASVDLRAALVNGTTGALPAAAGGDTVFVPGDAALGADAAAGAFLDTTALDRKVFVIGAVTDPGLYDRGPAVDVLTALAQARGPRADADLAGVRVVTAAGGTTHDMAAVLAGLAPAPPLPERGAAVVYVPAAGRGDLDDPRPHITVLGVVGRPGRYPAARPVPLFDLLAAAGGPGDKGSYDDIVVLHRAERFTMATTIDVERAAREGGSGARALVHPGDVVFVGKERPPVWQAVLKAISDLAILSAAVALFTRIR